MDVYFSVEDLNCFNGYRDVLVDTLPCVRRAVGFVLPPPRADPTADDLHMVVGKLVGLRVLDPEIVMGAPPA